MTATVLIVMGSDSDLPVMKKARDVLGEFDVSCEMRVCSAHRTPEVAHQLATEARTSGRKVIIAAAGMAAHLAGVMAANTTLPVIGVPISSGALHGEDALFSTVQMPPGIPVATVGIDGSKNAAILAVQILARSDAGLQKQLHAYKERLAGG